MKPFILAFALVLLEVLALPRGFAEVQGVEKKEFFSTKGTLMRVETGEKKFFLKNEGGLELTFHADESTRLAIGQNQTSLADLAPGDSLEIDYVYNENYEKTARSIRKQKNGDGSVF